MKARLYLALSMFFALMPAMTLAQGARLKPMPWNYVKLKQLDWGLIPTTISPTVQNEQVLTLLANGFPDLTISPVRFVDSPESAPWSNCGVYFLPKGGKQTFVSLFGSDDPGHCEGTQAVGMMSDPGPRPRLILICKVMSPHGPVGSEPVILSWDAANSMYSRNERQTDWLYDQKAQIGTVVSVRRLLARYGHES